MNSDTVKRFIDAQNNLVVQHSDFSLRALYDMAVSGSIELDPHYQRRDRWRPAKQSALIESFILNVPVPPVYLSEDDFGKYSVIDGKQRITAIRDFLSGDLKLAKLTRFKELEGSRYANLPTQIQNALSVRPYIRVITLLKQTDPQLKYEVFLRLNTGGERLLAQEIRNVAFASPLNDLLVTLSAEPFLRKRMKIKDNQSMAYRKMEDVEHVLRFFTIRERWQSIGQILSEEMDTFMRENRNASQGWLKELAETFRSSLEACEQIWGNHAFYKPQGSGWRAQFISPMFDAEMVAVSQFSKPQIRRIARNSNNAIRAFANAYKEDAEFAKAISQSTNNPSSIRKRISSVVDVLTPFS
jgi:Protein of unknown function DUF262